MAGRFLLGMVLVAFAVRPAIAELTWKVDANESSFSYVCGGDDWIVINGKANSVTITGACAVLEINGSDNRISIESVATIKLSGNNNDVRYTSTPDGKKRPVIKNKGAANTVRRSS